MGPFLLVNNAWPKRIDRLLGAMQEARQETARTRGSGRGALQLSQGVNEGGLQLLHSSCRNRNSVPLVRGRQQRRLAQLAHEAPAGSAGTHEHEPIYVFLVVLRRFRLSL